VRAGGIRLILVHAERAAVIFPACRRQCHSMAHTKGGEAMKTKTFMATLVAMAVLAATAAQAATATYKIKKIDAATHELTLGNDQIYVFPNDFKFDDYKVGDLVRVTFTSEGGKNNASGMAKQQ
jgi:Cu/Ag efflux protein CusF